MFVACNLLKVILLPVLLVGMMRRLLCHVVLFCRLLH